MTAELLATGIIVPTCTALGLIGRQIVAAVRNCTSAVTKLSDELGKLREEHQATRERLATLEGATR
jgi:cell division protein FtsB